MELNNLKNLNILKYNIILYILYNTHRHTFTCHNVYKHNIEIMEFTIFSSAGVWYTYTLYNIIRIRTSK